MIRRSLAAAASIALLLSGNSIAHAGAIDRMETGSIAPPARSGKTSVPGVKAGLPGVKTETGKPYGAIIDRYAALNGVDEDLAHAVVRVESNYNPKLRGSAGEVGLMQIKPATARMMGYRGTVKGLYDPETNIRYGMKYLAMAQTLGGGETCNTILKYNAGHGAKRMNPVSRRYCGKVTMLLAES
ncbi:lytic transglycosylase domain-containing protein [Gellertiella hungarica]|uniref:Soluble lytic murein transglycosylase-like protein n=1 Tax=Gellertiella hungarica TaxID=1572859 RepID=A0A7W6J2F8_9HYPH|nr:transglycosylase SLT domain-containing protein [Gellertiella hungarica]MBB4063538.1 soluble lytic murein transglycosylase-like protein [Gellertiella hungarica]